LNRIGDNQKAKNFVKILQEHEEIITLHNVTRGIYKIGFQKFSQPEWKVNSSLTLGLPTALLPRRWVLYLFTANWVPAEWFICLWK
jgi:hypothetical protein